MNRFRWYRTMITGLFFSALPFALNAQTKVKQSESGMIVTGSIVDSITHQPIELVTVVLSDKQGAVAADTVSLEDGSFKLNATKGPGTYTIGMSVLGYKSKIAGIIVADKDTIIKLGHIALSRLSGVLGTVTVKSKRPLFQSKGDKLIYNAAADISNKAGSASDVLRKAPMISVGADGEVKLRGSSNIKVLINGIPPPILAKNLKEALKMIPASSIDHVEIITTPSAKYEAEGAAGVINIVTKKKINGTSGNIDLGGGNLEQSANAGLNIAKGKFNFNFTWNANKQMERHVSDLNRIPLINGQNAGALLQQIDAMQKDISTYGDITTEFRPDSTQKLGATISLWKGQWPAKTNLYSFSRINQQISEYRQNSRQTGKFSMATISLNYTKKFKPAGKELQLVGQYSHSLDETGYITHQYSISGEHLYTEQSPNKGKSADISLQADYAQPLSRSGKQLLETGLMYSANKSTSRFSVFNAQGNAGYPLTEDASRSNSMDYFQNILSGYVSILLQSKSNWVLRPGLRYELTALGGDFQKNAQSFRSGFGNWVPGVLLTRRFNDRHDIKLNYTQRIRRPWIWDLNPYVDASDPKNLTYGNPLLKPEVTRLAEIGHTYSASAGFTLNSSLFFASNSNAIESLASLDSAGVSYTSPKNIASNKRLGLNLNTNISLNRNWVLNGGVELYHNRFKSSALNVSNNATYLGLSVNSSYNLPANYTVQASADFNNGFVTIQGRNSAGYSYHFSLRKEFIKKQASLTLAINNPFQNTLLQRNYLAAPTFQSTSVNRYYNRSFTLSFSWQFGNLNGGSKDRSFAEEEEKPARRGKR